MCAAGIHSLPGNKSGRRSLVFVFFFNSKKQQNSFKTRPQATGILSFRRMTRNVQIATEVALFRSGRLALYQRGPVYFFLPIKSPRWDLPFFLPDQRPCDVPCARERTKTWPTIRGPFVGDCAKLQRQGNLPVRGTHKTTKKQKTKLTTRSRLGK